MGNCASRNELLDSEIIGAKDEDVGTESETDNKAFDSDGEDMFEGHSDANGAGTDYMRSIALTQYIMTSFYFMCFMFVTSFLYSSLNAHLGHNLSKEEVDDLSKRKWKYKWEVPAVDMSNCKWRGTGECFMKVPFVYHMLAIYLSLILSILPMFSLYFLYAKHIDVI